MENLKTLPTSKILALDPSDRIELFASLSFEQLEALCLNFTILCDKTKAMPEKSAESNQQGLFGKFFNRKIAG